MCVLNIWLRQKGFEWELHIEIDTIAGFYENECKREKFAKETLSNSGKINLENKEGDCSVENNVRTIMTMGMKNRESIYISREDIENDLAIDQKNDNILKLVRGWIESGQKPSWVDIAQHKIDVKYYWNRLDSFDIKDDILCRKWECNDGDKIEWQKVIPEKQRPSILKQLHDSVTGGIKVLKRLLAKLDSGIFG